MRKFITILLLLCALTGSAKLTKFILRGYAERQDYSKTEWQHENVDSVYIAIVQNDTVMVPFKLLRGDNEMKMSPDGQIRALVEGGIGDYTLILNAEGYEPLRHDFKVTSEGQDIVYLRSVFMEPKRETTLDEVSVVGTAIKMVMKGDTIVYDSAAFQLPEGSTLDALVRQLPGAELDADGSITVNGKKVSSLLINGNDFFQGDPEVALKNLPSYTVDKIKVYDKASKDDYLTLESQRLSDSPLDENIVMDVQLKKEFSMATIFSLEGGYGPGIYNDGPKKWDSRYLGRAFIIGFGKTYRFSLYGNANNIGNTSRATSYSKDWGWSGGVSGDGNSTLAGFDFFYQPNDKVEASADMQYTRQDMLYQSLSASTLFYPSGNLYSRSRYDMDQLQNTIKGHLNGEYRGSNIYLRGSAYVSWTSVRNIRRDYTVNLDRNPYEQTRGAVIDSVFSRIADAEMSEQLRNSITSTSYKGHRNYGEADAPCNLNVSANISATYTPKTIRGNFNLKASISDVRDTKQEGWLYYQPISAAPVRRNQWTDLDNRNTDAAAAIGYSWEKNYLGEIRSNRLSIDASGKWRLERQTKNDVFYEEALASGFEPGQLMLPSQVETLTAQVDPDNTVRSLFLNNSASGSVKLSWRNEPIAPGDSTANLSYDAIATFNHFQNFRHLSYNKDYVPFHYRRNLSDPTESAEIIMSMSSNNKLRYMHLTLVYRYSTSLFNIFNLVPTENSSDPLHIYLGPEDINGFRSPSSHHVSLYFYHYGSTNHSNSSAYADININRNAQAYASWFDPSTGVTTSMPRNINGNWNLDAYGRHNHPFGPQECWSAGASASYRHNNSVDYFTRTGTPERSVVRNDEIGANISLSFSIKRDSPFKGTRFSLGGGIDWEHATSPRADFRAISAWCPSANAGINFYLPGGVEGETSLKLNMRRGYQDSALNTTEWLWNASVQKSVLNGSLTFKLNAVDLLGQISRIYSTVNAQGRTETWHNSMPRYVMLTVGYRFNYTPKALKN